jgi:hypothetical protein
MIKKNTRGCLASSAMATAIFLLTGTWVTSADPYATVVLGDSPTAFWQLNETNGTVAYDSAGEDNGSYTNVVLGQPGVELGQSGYAPGTDTNALSADFGAITADYGDCLVGGMTLDFATTGNAEFSAEAWVFSGGNVSSASIIGKGTNSGEEFYLDCGGANAAFRFFIRNAAGTSFSASGAALSDGNWHHLVGVCDEANSKILLYVDGRLEASSAASGGIRTATAPYMNIGIRPGNATYNDQFFGNISDVAIYNYALTATQVLNHYYAVGVPPTIISQPANAITVIQGSTLSLTNVVMGTPTLSYQWILNGNALPGATNASLTISNVDISYNNDFFYLNVSNAYGTVNSTGTELTINSGVPEILTNVPSQLTLYQGETFAYSVVAGGALPFYYQWLQNGNAIPGATNASYTATALNGSYTYSVLVSNSVDGGSITPSGTSTLTSVAPPTAPYPATIVAANPVAYWRLDEPANSTVANEYMGGHDGTYNNNVVLGVPGYTPLDADTAAYFGGVSSFMAETDNSANGLPRIDFAAPTGSNAEFSVECWANGPAGQSTSGSTIVRKGLSGDEEFVLDASAPGGAYRFYIREPGGSVPSIYASSKPDGTWHHLVAVCDQANGVMTLYVDGNPQGAITGIGGTGIFETTVPVAVGAQNDGSYAFNGTIDEVSLYNYALTAAQVQAHYAAAPLPPYFTQLPVTTVAGYVGENVTLAAVALGSTPQTNQWYANGTALTGQNSVALVLTDIQSGTNTYVLKVSNAYGVTNTPGTVISVPGGSGPPQLLTDVAPLATTRYATVPITYSVSASGSAPLYYQWFFNTNAIARATNASYTIASLTTNNTGGYYCVISNVISVIDSSTGSLQVVAAPTNVYPLTVLLDHPVAYYRLDEPVGAPVGYDYVGGNNGLYTGAVVLNVPGFDPQYDSDTACTFGNNNNTTANCLLGYSITNVDFSKPNGQSGAFSVEAWINGSASVSQTSGGALLAKGFGSGGEQFALDAHFGIRFYVRNAAAATVANAQSGNNVCGSIVGGNYQMDGKWHHIVAVCDQINSNLLLYVDGTLIGPNVITNGVVPPLVYENDLGHPGSTGTNGVIYAGTGIFEPVYNVNLWNSVSIGSRNKGTGSTGASAYTLPFVGTVDDAALYNYALTPAQVYAHYAVGTGQSLPLSIQTTNGVRTITWLSAAALESAQYVTGPWTTVTNAVSPYTVPTGSSQQYYRLQLH